VTLKSLNPHKFLGVLPAWRAGCFSARSRAAAHHRLNSRGTVFRGYFWLNVVCAATQPELAATQPVRAATQPEHVATQVILTRLLYLQLVKNSDDQKKKGRQKFG